MFFRLKFARCRRFLALYSEASRQSDTWPAEGRDQKTQKKIKYLIKSKSCKIHKKKKSLRLTNEHESKGTQDLSANCFVNSVSVLSSNNSYPAPSSTILRILKPLSPVSLLYFLLNVPSAQIAPIYKISRQNKEQKNNSQIPKMESKYHIKQKPSKTKSKSKTEIKKT